MLTIFPPILSDLFEHSPRRLNFFSTFRLLSCFGTPAVIQNTLENQNNFSSFQINLSAIPHLEQRIIVILRMRGNEIGVNWGSESVRVSHN